MKLLILNGPNLNLLGLREPAIYGTQNYDALVRFCQDACRAAGAECKVFQSNHEGALVDGSRPPTAFTTASSSIPPPTRTRASPFSTR